METRAIIAPRNLVWSTRVLSVIGAMALALTGEVKIFTFAVYALLLLLGVRIERMQKLVWIAGRAQPVFALLVFGLAIFDFANISQSFLLVVAHFLLLIQALRLLSLVSVRDNIGSVMLSSLMILSASTLSVDWTFFAVLVLFLPAVIWSVVWANLYSEYQIAGETGAPDMRAAVWKRVVPAAKIATSMAFFVAALMCAFVFMTFPRLNLQGFRGQFLQPVRKTGFTNNVELRSGGRIDEDNTIIMRVEMSDAHRAKWNGYLRGAALDVFNGQYWRKSVMRSDRLYRGFQTGLSLPIVRSSRGRLIRQSIYLESLDTTLLFAAPWPTWIALDQPFVERGDDLSLSRRQGNTWRVHYTVDSYLPDNGVLHEHRRSSDLPSSYRDVKGVDVGRLNGLMKQVVSPGQSAFDMAKAIEVFLRTNYTYTLDLGQRAAGNPMDVFFFERKKGHCEYFAAAMCLMLRSRGVPTRMATGFVAHEWNARGGYYIVRMRDAHAWVEAYIAGRGWMSFDPTPRDFQRPVVQNEWARRLNEALDYMNLQWNRQILSYDFERQVNIVRNITNRSQTISFRFENMASMLKHMFGGQKKIASNSEPGRSINDGLMLAIVLSIFVSAVAWLLVHRLRLKKHQTVWFYHPLLVALERVGGKKPPSRTMKEFTEQLSDRLGGAAESANFLADEYHRQRFGCKVADEESARRVQQALMELKRQKIQRLPSLASTSRPQP